MNYHRNSLAAIHRPLQVQKKVVLFHYQEKVEGRVIHARSKSLSDHFSQASLFWNSMLIEKKHIIDAFIFELEKVKSMSVKQQVVDMFANVSLDLARSFAKKIGANPPKTGGSNVTKASPALSQQNTIFTPYTLKIAVILTNGFKGPEVKYVLDHLAACGLNLEIISENQGEVRGTNGVNYKVAHTFLTAKSVQFDGVYIVNGSKTGKKFNKDAAYFIDEAFSHYKPIGATHEGIQFLTLNNFNGKPASLRVKIFAAFQTNL